MKKTLVIVLAVVLLLLAGCSSSKQSQDSAASQDPAISDPEQKSIEAVDGYYATTPTKLPMKIQTPIAWAHCDPEDEDSELIAGYLAEGRISYDLLDRIKNNPMIVFFDTANTTDTFISSINVIGFDAEGLTLSDFQKSEADMSEGYKKRYIDASMEDFEWIVEPKGKTLGNNYYFVMVFSFTNSGYAFADCQAMTIYKGQNYMFTYTLPQNSYQNEMLTEFEKVLSTVEFTA